ncbi:hypothetical protein ACC685_33485 [Rhizobium ruizarguesonis]
MKKAIANIRQVLRAVLRSMARFLANITSRKGGAGSIEAAAGMAPEASDAIETADGDEIEPDTEYALARKRAGLEPSDVKAYAAADTKEARLKLAGIMTTKTRNWVMSMDGNQLDILAKSSPAEIASHISGREPLTGVKPIPFGLKVNKANLKVIDPMKNPHAPNLASKVIDQVHSLDNKPSADDARFDQIAKAREARTAKAMPTVPHSYSYRPPLSAAR